MNQAQLATLRRFVSADQLQYLIEGERGEKGQYFREKIAEICQRIDTMPKTYEQDGLGEEAVVSLHYFTGNMDWMITERDESQSQRQAFGWADLGYGGEWGYISIAELIANGAELDLHFTPRRFAELAEAWEVA